VQTDSRVHFVYPYIPSQWDELKYSIRSIEMNYKGDYDITIMGAMPEWANGDLHICIQQSGHYIQETKRKLYHTFSLFSFHDDIVWMNDDIYLLKETTKDTLSQQLYVQLIEPENIKLNENPWKIQLKNTISCLKENGYTYYNFECHTPSLFNLNKMMQVFQFLDKSLYNDLWGINTAYYNYHGHTDNLIQVSNARIGFYKEKAIPANIDDYQYLNHNDRGLTPELKQYIKDKFPKKSRFER
jgi:hypothetical protein